VHVCFRINRADVADIRDTLLTWPDADKGTPARPGISSALDDNDKDARRQPFVRLMIPTVNERRGISNPRSNAALIISRRQ